MNNDTSNHRKTGSQGEEQAADFLKANGYFIECRNYHFSNRGEIDIIARKDGILVFIEVKTALTDKFGEPEYWVTPAKQQQIVKVARAYLYSKNITDTDCRFDVIALQKEGDKHQINHYENAFTG
jgi:putative endonuclease